MNDKELIAEAEKVVPFVSKMLDKGVADFIQSLADALEARQPCEDDREAVTGDELADAVRVYRKVSGKPANSEGIRAVLAFSRAAVPDAATEVLDAHKCHESAERAYERTIRAEAERDAALAAVERVRAIHVRHKDTHKPDPSVINGNWFCCGAVQLGAVDPYACIACDSPEWPCPTIAALDGAPEPEGRWEYRVEYQVPGGETHAIRPRATFEDAYGFMLENIHGGTVMRRTKAIPAGPWLPVEGEKP